MRRNKKCMKFMDNSLFDICDLDENENENANKKQYFPVGHVKILVLNCKIKTNA